MAAGEVVMHAWKEWGLQALVLLSFTLQAVLLILAEFRRRMDPGVLQAFLWSAYLLADSTAIYVLGHLSASNRTPEHELMAFWAPFLLLHLGGQDNITAYSIDDCQLWLRHLQTLVVQVAAAAYVLYESSIFGPSRSLLLPASMLVFAVGVVKCGERVWALRCAGIGALAMKEQGTGSMGFGALTAIDDSEDQGVGAQVAMSDLDVPGFGDPDRFQPSSYGLPTSWQDTEGLLLVAHLLLGVPKDFFKMPLHGVDVSLDASHLTTEDMYKVAEMQLSLMQDVFYTKAEVICSWYGLCIRIFSALAIVITLLLFHLLLLLDYHHRKPNSSYSIVDVSITYVLLGGAVILELTSLLRAVFSSWTCALFAKAHARKKLGVKVLWRVIGRGIMSLRRLVGAANLRKRYWSGSIGQHDLFDLGVRSRASRISRMVRWMGVEDPWNTLVYSRSTPISPEIKRLVAEQVFKRDHTLDTSPYHILNSRGRAALMRWGCNDALSFSVVDIELEESILIWHIATNIFLSAGNLLWDVGLVDAVRALSNYMVFLLAVRPSMLPPPAIRNAYIKLCSDISVLQYNSTEHLAFILYNYGKVLNTGGSTVSFVCTTMSEHRRRSLHDNQTLKAGSKLGAMLLDMESSHEVHEDVLQLVAQGWVEILCYAGYRCTTNSHSKQLSNGGDLITVAALLLEHRKSLDTLMASDPEAHFATDDY
ncbi:unnamed protein product [Urochloa decumbens]|uniref:DUF4220 domain-containing protein n=1 Tax=Urochloa decumbens TaxID=240449 RepID=A0ABC9CDG1_9POAL